MKTNKKGITLSLFYFITLFTLQAQDLSFIGKPKKEHYQIPQKDLQKKPAPSCQAHNRATFVGGNKMLINYIKNNLYYPALAMENGIEGSVQLRFIVDSEGFLGDIKVIRSMGYGCDKQAVDLLRKMPAWQPAIVNGAPRASLNYLEIQFKLY
jgi:TonB family protein